MSVISVMSDKYAHESYENILVVSSNAELKPSCIDESVAVRVQRPGKVHNRQFVMGRTRCRSTGSVINISTRLTRRIESGRFEAQMRAHSTRPYKTRYLCAI